MPKGFKHSEETKKKISEIHSGKILSVKHKEAISLGMKGKNTWSKGKKVSEETRQLLKDYQLRCKALKLSQAALTLSQDLNMKEIYKTKEEIDKVFIEGNYSSKGVVIRHIKDDLYELVTKSVLDLTE